MSDKTDKTAQPMDAGAEEISNPVMATNTQRTAHGVKTLIAEVLELFPETPYEVSGYDGRNTALDVTFDLSNLDEGEQRQFMDLLSLVKSDIRVRGVITEEDSVLVEFRRSPRTQDSRDPFNLADAWSVLTESEEPDGLSAGISVPPDGTLSETIYGTSAGGWTAPSEALYEFPGGMTFEGESASETSDDVTDDGGA